MSAGHSNRRHFKTQGKQLRAGAKMFSALMLQIAGSRNCLKIEQNIRVGA
jgi:hypothetical protein